MKEFIMKNKAVGRPSKYKKEFCEMLINHMKQGLSFESFGGVIGVAKDTLYQWVKKHKEFSDAKKIGTSFTILYWEKLGIAGTLGRIPGFNSTSWIFNMKNRETKWKDRQDITSGEEKISGEVVKVELPKNGRDG